MTDHAQDPSATVPATVPAPLVFTFTNGKPHAVRVLTDAQGEPLFHAGDLCDLLEHTNSRQALAQHVEPDDVTKRYVIDRMGRKQLVNFVREPGMWSLVLGSHAPNAKKVKRWVTAEVLPAIRRTGRYQVPAAPLETAPEYLSDQDEANLSRLAWLVSYRMPLPKSAAHAFWHRLRQVTGVPSPGKFEVRHLPVLAEEVARIHAQMEAFHAVQYRAAQRFIKRVVRTGGDAAPLLAEIAQEIEDTLGKSDEELKARIAPWLTRQIAALAGPGG